MLTNTDGYSVLANTTDSKLDLHALITWDSLGAPIDYTFQDATVAKYGAQAAAKVAAGKENNMAITLKIVGLDRIPEGEPLELTPQIISETKISVMGEMKAWPANS